MSKLEMICDREIGQFTVTVDGLYAWRRVGLLDDVKDSAWTFGICKAGTKIDGQYEGTGPIHWKTTADSNEPLLCRN